MIEYARLMTAEELAQYRERIFAAERVGLPPAFRPPVILIGGG